MAYARDADSKVLRGGAVVFVVLAALGAGCQSIENLRPIPESERAGNAGKPMEWVEANGKRDEAKYKVAFDACYAEAYGYSSDNRGSDKSYEFRRCMRLKGWHEVPVAK